MTGRGIFSPEMNREKALLRSPASHKVCPACGLEASLKYFNEKKKKWVYKHAKRYEPSVYHEAEK